MSAGIGETQKWTKPGIGAEIHCPHVYREFLPLGPSWPDVQRLLKNIETDHPYDMRDAIMLLLAVYGLLAAPDSIGTF